MSGNSRCAPLSQLSAPSPSLYRRKLPSAQISFTVAEGKRRFLASLQSGNAEPFYRLISCFQTQDEPAYCGLTTLAMILNALEIDPRRIWKRPWRWFSEQTLSCCVDMEYVKKMGVSMEQVACLAVCNGAKVSVIRDVEEKQLRAFLRRLMREFGDDNANEGCFAVASYSRKVLGQTGDGHFSAIAAFHQESDSCLVLDVARFKYPPHWIKIRDLVEALNTVDLATGKRRGLMVFKKAQEVPKTLIMNIRRASDISPRNALQAVELVFSKHSAAEEIDIPKLAINMLEACKTSGSVAPLDIVECRLDLCDNHGEHELEEKQTTEIRDIFEAIMKVPLYRKLEENEEILQWIPERFCRVHGLVYITLFLLVLVITPGWNDPNNVYEADKTCECCASIKYEMLYKVLTGFEWKSTPLALMEELEVLRTQLRSVSSFM